MKGNVKWFNPQKGIGFITGPDGQDRFLHKRELKKGYVPSEGDEVEFDSRKGPKGFFATKIKLVAAAAPKAAQSTKRAKPETTPEAKKVEAPPPKGIGIDSIALEENLEGDSLIVPIWVLVKSDGIPLIGIGVELTVIGATKIEPKPKLSTDGSGKSIFFVSLPKDMKMALIMVKSRGKEISGMWKKGEGITRLEPTTAEDMVLTVTPAAAAQWMVYDIAISAKSERLITAEISVTVRPQKGSFLLVREAHSATWEQVNPSGTVFPCRGGRMTLHVRIAELAAGLVGDYVIFGISGTTTDSKPFYVSGRYIAPHVAGPSEATASTEPTPTETKE